jgi:hypothetical protein
MENNKVFTSRHGGTWENAIQTCMDEINKSIFP